MELKKLQDAFISHCTKGEQNRDFLAQLDDSIISNQALMRIYVNSTRGNIVEAMRLTFPTVEKLVGADFFRVACYHYIEVAPPKSSNMNDYGDGFAHFLQNFEPASTLLYLPDTAALDWAIHQSAHAPAATYANWNELQQKSPEEILQLTLQLHPSVHLLSSPFPVHKIWEFNQKDALDSSLNIHQDHLSYLLVQQPQNQLGTYEISAAEFSFLLAISQHKTMEQAMEAATKIDADIDLQTCFAKFIAQKTICNFG